MDDRHTFQFIAKSERDAEIFVDSLYLKELPDLREDRNVKVKIIDEILNKVTLKIPLRMLGFRKVSFPT